MVFRHEHKHVINMCDAILLHTRLKNVMNVDRYADENGEYTVKSLYFDNYMDKALKEKIDGVDKREKFRIRYYNDDTSFIRLEKKSKINGLCSKVSAPLTSDECEKIINGDIEFLMEKDSELLKEFYAKMRYQLLRPKCIVAYDRESYTYPVSHTRVTIDKRIRGSTNVCEFLNSDVTFTHLYPHSILEVKYDEFIPEIVKKAVSIKSRKMSAFSKYAAARFY